MSVGKWSVGNYKREVVTPLPRRVLAEKRGIALVTVLLFMGALLILGTAFLTISSTETQIAINERRAVQAFFLAEAGANKALSQLNADEAYAGEIDTPLGPGTFTVTVDDIPTPPGSFDRKRVTSFGYVPDSATPAAAARVEVVVERGSPFRWAAFGLDKVTFNERGVTDSYDSQAGAYEASDAGAEGDIGSNDLVDIKEDVTINGDALAGGSLEKDGGVVITGMAKENAYPVALASVSIPSGSGSDEEVSNEGVKELDAADEDEYGELEVENDGTIFLHPGTYTFYGKIRLNKGAELKVSGKVRIYLTGEFTADENVRVNADAPALPTDLFIYSSGDKFEIDKSAIFYGAVYARDAEVKVAKLNPDIGDETDSASGDVFGSLIGKDIDVGKNQRFHFDEALLKEKSPYGPFRPVAGTWQEVIPSP
ncbi:MAG: PilX N-terminal domain-containing pilus assembly protein [Candidatus Methylomirabilales bacterium]